MVNLRGNKTPKKAGGSPAKSPMKTGPKTPLVKTPGKAVVRTPKPTPLNTPMSRKREMKQEEDVEDEEIFNKKAKHMPKGRKSLPPKVPLKAEESDSEDEEQSDDEVELNVGGLKTESNDEEEDDDSSEGEDDDDDDDDGDDKDDKKDAVKQKAVKKEKKPKIKKELHDTPTILVRNLQDTASENDLKFHFKACGEIVSCKIMKDKKSNQLRAFIQFKQVIDAKSAEATLNGKPFKGRNISVNHVRSATLFTKEDTIVISDLPHTNKPKSVYQTVKATLSKFGKVKYIKFTPNMSSGNVQFEDNAGAAAAVKAGTFEVMGSSVRVVPYGDYVFETPDTKVVLFGITDDITVGDIQKAVSKHAEISSLYIPNDKDGKKLTNQIHIGLKTESDAQKLLALKTIKLKDTVVDVLPHAQSKFYHNSVTKVYYRHPAAVFIENLRKNLDHMEIYEAMNKFGPVQRVNRFNKNMCAVAFFEQKADALKALKTSNPKIKELSVKFHAVDGIYSPSENPALGVGTTVYISKIADRKDITEVIKKVKALKLTFTRILPNDDPLTRHFKNSMFIELDSKESAKKLVSAEIKLDDKPVSVELYDPAKHDFVAAKTLVMVENLDDGTKDADLWKGFQSFGEINSAVILRNARAPIGCGYVEFKGVDSANKALKSTNVEINGNKVKVVKPTPEVIDKIRKKVAEPFRNKFKQSKSKGPKGKMGKKSPRSPKTFKNKSTFKKKSFKKGGVKTPRRSL